MALTRIRTDNIEDSEVGKVDLADKAVDVNKLDVESWAGGDILSIDIDGNLLFVPPSSSGGIPRLGELLDVDLVNLLDGQRITYQAATQTWVNSDDIDSLDSLIDTNIVSNVAGEYLYFDGTEWINKKIDYSDITNIPPIDYDDIINKPDVPANGDFTFIELADTFNVAVPNAYLRWSGDGSEVIYETTIAANVITGLADVATSGDYGDLINVPTEFPPSAHTHVEADITDLDKYTTAEVDALLAGKADTEHTHEMSDITDATWISDISAESIFDLVDVDGTDAEIGKILKWNGTAFIMVDESVSDISNKADKVIGATAGNFAGLDATGNLIDSGVDAGDFALVDHTHTKADITDFDDSDYATAEQGALADTAVQPGDNISVLVNDAGYLTSIDSQLLGDLGDVTLVTPASSEVLQFNGAVWTNSAFSYNDLADIPTEFAPSAHTHVEADITDLDKYTTAEVDALLAGKADDDHTHVMADITDATWISDITNESIGDLSDVVMTGIATGQILEWNGAHFVPTNNISGVSEFTALTDTINDYVGREGQGLRVNLAGTGVDTVDLFSGDYSDLAGVPTEFAPSAHTHEIAEVNGLQDALDLKANDADLAVVAKTGDYNDLLNLPDLPVNDDYSLVGLSDTDNVAVADAYLRWSSDGSTVIYDTSIDASVITGLATVATTGEYNDLLNIPTEFAPSAHTHVEADITDLDKYTKAEVDALLTDHTHVEADITDLDKYSTSEVDALLANKSDTDHTHVEADITDLDKYSTSEVDALLAGKADTDHTHVKADITDFNDADYATAAQGALADTALQPGDNVSELVNDAGYITDAPESIDDLNDVDITGITSGQILRWNGTTFIAADESAVDVSDKADKVLSATAGNFAGLDATGNLTDSGVSSVDFATAAQGALADTALQSGDNVSELVNDAGYLTTISALSIDELTDVDTSTAAPSVGQVLGWDGTNFVPVDKTADGATTFVGLDDTPASYAGQAGRFIVVNGSEDSLEFGDVTGFLTAVEDDTAPKLGGDLDVNGNDITSEGSLAIITGADSSLNLGVPNSPYDAKVKLYGADESMIEYFVSIGGVSVSGTRTYLEQSGAFESKYVIETGQVMDIVSPVINFKAAVESTNGYSLTTVDGEENQVLMTDAVGNVTFQDIDYNDLENVPTEFAPSAHTHEIAEVNGLQDALDLKANDADLAVVAKTGDYNDLINTPVIPSVPEELDDLSDVNASSPNENNVLKYVGGNWVNDVVDYGDLVNVPTDFAPSAHTHEIAEVDGLQDALDLKANIADLGTVAFDNDYESLDNKPDIPLVINDLSDVTISNPIDGLVLTYSTDGWYAMPPSGGVEEAPVDNEAYGRKNAGWTQVLEDITDESIGDLTDVDITGIATGQILEWDGSAFVAGNKTVGGASTFLELSDVPNSFATHDGKILYVDEALGELVYNNAVGIADINTIPNRANKVASATSGNLAALDENGDLTDSGFASTDFVKTTDSIGALSDVDLSTAPELNEVLAWDGNNFVPVANGGAGATTFQELTDTPNNYTAQAGKMVVVNSNEDGVEYTDVIDGGTF